MIIKPKQIKSIKENKVTLVPKFISLDPSTYDFNWLSEFIELWDQGIICKKDEKTTPQEFLRGSYQIQHLHLHDKNAFIYLDFFKKMFSYDNHPYDGTDVFFSFCSSTGGSHKDDEDVFIISLFGKTIYRLFSSPSVEKDTNYFLEPGDLIYVPRQTSHRAISVGPRINFSVGCYGIRR